jgi:hypothetical protein
MDLAPNTRLEAGFEVKQGHVEEVDGRLVYVIDDARLFEISVVPDTPENRAAGSQPMLAAYSVDRQTEPGVTRVHIASPDHATVLLRITGQTDEFDTPDAEGAIMLRSTYYGRVEPYGRVEVHGHVGPGEDGADGGAAERPGGGGAPAGGDGPADRSDGGGDPGGRPNPPQPDAPGGVDPRRVPPSRQRPDALPD